MKNLIITLLLAAVTATAANAQIKQAKITASGLTCSMCSKAIYKALEKVAFVEGIETDIENSIYTLTFKPGAKVVLDALKNAVTDAGFSVAKMEVTANFPTTEVANDKHITYDGSTYHFVGVKDQMLSGAQTFTILDEDFTSKKEHRKYGKLTTMKCYETGKMESCCKGNTADGRVYHITL